VPCHDWRLYAQSMTDRAKLTRAGLTAAKLT
jgi:hypothetical protein